MAVILWILAVLLGLLLLAVLLAVLLLHVRAGIEAVGATGAVSIEARYGPVRVPVWPPPKHLKKPAKKPKGQAGAPGKSAKKPKYRYTLNREAVDIGALLELALTLLGELAGRLRISRLRVRVRIGTADAAQTGLLLGLSAAVTGMVLPFLENTFDMQDYHADVDADFDAAHTEWAFTVQCTVRPASVIWVLLRHGRTLYRLYKRLIRKEEATEHE